MIVDRLGQCNKTCGNTEVIQYETYKSCTNKIGCRPPNYNTNTNTTNQSPTPEKCVCYEEDFGPMDTRTGRCNCDTTAVSHNRGANCICDLGKYVNKSSNPLTCQDCPQG